MSYRPPPKLPSIKEIEDTLDWPTDRWRGQCYAVACSFVKHGIVEGKAVYGYYTGPISPKSIPFGPTHKLPFHHHGWIVTPEGWIVDPTRWVFEEAKPYIHVFEPDLCEDFDSRDGLVCQTCDHVYEEHVDHHKFFSPCSFSGLEYDEGGDRWRQDHEGPRPESTEDQRTIHLVIAPLVDDSLDRIQHLLHRPDTDALQFPLSVSVQEAAWLANLSTLTLGRAAGPLYRALMEADCGGFIPIDNRRMILEESSK